MLLPKFLPKEKTGSSGSCILCGVTGRKEENVQITACFDDRRISICRLQMSVFWDVAPCSPVEIYRRFRGN
jgi:hypothetical protein